MKNYVDYITDVTCRLLAIDSPTGYTKNAAEFVMDEYRKMGYEPKMTVKGCVLVDIGGKNKDNGIVLAAHADTLGAMVSEKYFEYLAAPVERVTCLDIPVSFAPSLEDYYMLTSDDIVAACKKTVEF